MLTIETSTVYLGMCRMRKVSLGLNHRNLAFEHGYNRLALAQDEWLWQRDVRRLIG